jgi:hypothetical protein
MSAQADKTVFILPRRILNLCDPIEQAVLRIQAAEGRVRIIEDDAEKDKAILEGP